MLRQTTLFAAAFLTAVFASAASDGRPGDEGPPKVSFPRTARKQGAVALKRRHEWTDGFRSAAGEFLSRVLTGQYVDESAP